MVAYATTKLSSKGQVVIPEEVCKNLGLNEERRAVAGIICRMPHG